ncbi:hypothetical protein LTR49_016249 [Elasticomyces elasticus]|nr:hypothetical protein LTR49_016249 [Elasticomyces elasticus]KAK5752633.1 hypothetical protein LTS12_017296 [Elasticomyces elasticus]
MRLTSIFALLVGIAIAAPGDNIFEKRACVNCVTYCCKSYNGCPPGGIGCGQSRASGTMSSVK